MPYFTPLKPETPALSMQPIALQQNAAPRFSANINILSERRFWRHLRCLRSENHCPNYEPFSVAQRRELTERSLAKLRYSGPAFDCTTLQLSEPKQRGRRRAMLHLHLESHPNTIDETQRGLPDIIRHFKKHHSGVVASIWGGDSNDPRFTPNSTQNKSIIEGVLNSLEIPFRKLWGQKYDHGAAAYETRRGDFYLYHTPLDSNIPISTHPSEEWLRDHYSERKLLPGDRLFINDRLVLEEPAR